jgi:ribose/xylose/arabinose/galactoside ABC-type transport system permease subunit
MANTRTEVPPAMDGLRQDQRASWRPSVGSVLALAGFVVLAWLMVSTSGFLSSSNLRATISGMAFVGIVAVGLTPITISGSLFSLTLGTTVAMSAVLFVGTLRLGLIPALVITLVVGVVAGALQGWLVGSLDANPIIVTVAAGSLEGGLASWFTKDATMYPPANQTSWQALSETPVGLPIAVYALMLLVLVLALAMTSTRWGRLLYLIGDNRKAAHAAGLPVSLVLTLAFAISSASAALAGIFIAAFSGNATTQIGGTLSFDAIAAVLVGGTAIAGGRGSALRTFVGAAVIAVISNVLLLRGYQQGERIAATGVLVLVVVIVVHLRDRASS